MIITTKKMKKIILIVFLLFTYNNTHALQEEIILWCSKAECVVNTSFDIVPHNFETINAYIYARWDFSIVEEYVDLSIWPDLFYIDTEEDSDVFKLLYTDEIINYAWNILNITSTWSADVNSKIWTLSNVYEIKIILDYTVEEDEVLSGTWYIININDDPWINKKVFDLETIEEIYKYEAVIMVFIVFYTFMMRIIGRRQKRNKPFDL